MCVSPSNISHPDQLGFILVTEILVCEKVPTMAPQNARDFAVLMVHFHRSQDSKKIKTQHVCIFDEFFLPFQYYILGTKYAEISIFNTTSKNLQIVANQKIRKINPFAPAPILLSRGLHSTRRGLRPRGHRDWENQRS